VADVLRTRLLDLLDAHRDVPVVSVEAPGGFGKTTVLGQWAERDARPLVWITVRPKAPDATWLAGELVDGLCRVGVIDEPVTLPPALDPVSWHLGLLPVVEQAVASASRPFLVVVDEAGALQGPLWDGLAGSIATSLPTGCQLVLAARSQAPPSLRRLRSSGELAVVGPELLALDAVEGDQILRSLGLRLDQAVVLDLLEQTGGWPIALPLLASALQAGRWARTGARLATTQALADYLRIEVLEPLGADDARLLLRSSVLTEMDGPTCDAVTGSPGSLARLRQLAAATHLVAPLDVNAERFRLHPLLAAFLAEELRAADPGGWRGAHRAAARVAERAGDLDAAVFHLRAAADDAALGEVVWENGGVLLGRAEAAVLHRWLEGIDDARLERVPRLALAAAWVASHKGDMVRMERMRLAAHASAAARDPDFLLEVSLLDATVGAAGIEAIAQVAGRFLDSRRGTVWVTIAHLLQGIALGLLGDQHGACETIEQGRVLCEALEMPLMTAHCLAATADLALLAGDRARAVEAIMRARALMDRGRFDVAATSAPISTTLAYAYLLEGRVTQARAEAARALRLTALMRPVAPWHAVQGRLTLASVSLGLGDVARAKGLVAEAERLVGPATRSPVLDDMLRQVRERLSAAGSEGTHGAMLTTAEVRVLQYLPTHLSFPEIASELYVSRHTVKTQALSAYRKLGAHTRSEAIEKARERGLLPPRRPIRTVPPVG
jgi:LuxR family maltose regulon positive regulatory protein